MTTTHFLSLPIEIRLEIYRLILPHHTQIPFNQPTRSTWRRSWGRRSPEADIKIDIPTNLFGVNHQISSEAKHVLYVENEFTYEVNSFARSRVPPRLRVPGNNVLRQLCRLELTVKLSDDAYACNRRNRSRLHSFMKSFSGQTGGPKPALRHLKIRFDHFVSIIRGCRFEGYRKIEGLRRQYLLEELLPLRPVENVEVEGAYAWFAKCLELAITGAGGEVLEIEYPEVQYKRRKVGGHRKMPMTMSTRSWYMPKYNWEEYALRNGIAIPKDDVMFGTGA